MHTLLHSFFHFLHKYSHTHFIDVIDNKNTTHTMYTDATSLLRECQNEMKLGEMLMSKNFTLEKAMSAMELMDPKMDSGMSDPPSKSLEETTFGYVFVFF